MSRSVIILVLYRTWWLSLWLTLAPGLAAAEANPLPMEIVGVSVIPHVNVTSMKFRWDAALETGARVQLFIRNTASAKADPAEALHANVLTCNGREPQRLIADGEWSWHDTPPIWPDEENDIPPGAITVWTFNGLTPLWSTGQEFKLGITDWLRAQKYVVPVKLQPSRAWISALTFLSSNNVLQPDRLVCYITNASTESVKMAHLRLYLPTAKQNWRALYPQALLMNGVLLPVDGLIAPGEKGCLQVNTGPLPLTYAAVEVGMIDAKGTSFSIWAYQRIRREVFDISGGWVQTGGGTTNPLTQEPFLKTLKRLHITTAHINAMPGYTDQTGPEGLYARYPLKYFGAMRPIKSYDTDAVLPRIHAVEFLGEPQVEGSDGEKLPQEVYHAFQPYQATRLATTVTLSNPYTWNTYAGLADYPHFDAYRVCAPAADEWSKYERWGAKTIDWGAPLETIGDMCRSLRELSRPAPIAAWSQGPHFNWDSRAGRKRTSPTPEEMRLQAYHLLSSRITSLYWFNISLKSLVKYRDLIAELGRINREIKLLEDFYLEGDACHHQILRQENKPDWELASIVSPRGALLFALDLDYEPDRSEKVFVFKRPRPLHAEFALPPYLRNQVEVFRVDADGTHNVEFSRTPTGVMITDEQSKVAIYVATLNRELVNQFEKRRSAMLAIEQSYGFDPAGNDKDFELLKDLTKE